MECPRCKLELEFRGRVVRAPKPVKRSALPDKEAGEAVPVGGDQSGAMPVAGIDVS